jgi:hypothetical protein
VCETVKGFQIQESGLPKRDTHTGLFYQEQTIEQIIEAVARFNANDFDPQVIRKHALTFDQSHFKDKLERFIQKALSQR